MNIDGKEKTMLRYIIFAGFSLDTFGRGWNSALRDENGKVFSFDTIEEARAKFPRTTDKTTGLNPCDWAHIVDLQTGEIVLKR